MKIKINGAICEFDRSLSLEKLLSLQENMPQYYVVAVNYNCISAQDYSLVELNDGDEIEIVSPMQGG